MLESIESILQIIVCLLVITTPIAAAIKKKRMFIPKKKDIKGETTIPATSHATMDVSSDSNSRRNRSRSLDGKIGLALLLFSLCKLSFTTFTPLGADPLTAGSAASIGLSLFGVYLGFHLIRSG